MADHPPLPKRVPRKPKPEVQVQAVVIAPSTKGKQQPIPINLLKVDELIEESIVNLGGRPEVEIDLALVKRVASVGCSIDEIAVVCGVSKAAFYNHKAANPAIDEAIARGREIGHYTLRRMQWYKAQLGSDQMLIWLGKQILGQRDNMSLSGVDGEELRPPSINVTVVDNIQPRTPTIDVRLDSDVHVNGHDTSEHVV